MKLISALFAAAALTIAAGAAHADVRPDQIAGLQKSGAIGDLEQFNKQAQAKHPGFEIHDTELDKDVGGNYIYQIELKDAKGVEWNYDVNAKTGAVVRDEQDR